MKRTESISSAQELKNTQPEEFDLVILGGARAQTESSQFLSPKLGNVPSESPNLKRCGKTVLLFLTVELSRAHA